nr:uncharacterized protein LOC123771839 [Procambarus clarkii]
MRGDVERHQRAGWNSYINLGLPAGRAKDENSLAWIAMRAEGPLKADDPDLLELLRAQYLHPPDGLPYDLKEDAGTKDNLYKRYKIIYPSWAFIDSVTRDLFSEGEDAGFFVEAGALDGEYLSNTLWLERWRRWTGLLVEAEADSYAALRKKHRRAWSSPACLATNDYPHTAILTSFRRLGLSSEWTDRGAARIEEKPAAAGEGPGYKTYHNAQCFPALTFFLALNITRVHFFSLDVEGVEMGVLRSFPFDQITVDVWAIEHVSPSRNSTPRTQTSSGGSSQQVSWLEDPEFIAFMEARGYYLFDMFCNYIPDYIFVRRGSDVFKRLRVPERMWKRRGICLHKSIWDEETKVFEPNLHRDKRHWPILAYSG